MPALLFGEASGPVPEEKGCEEMTIIASGPDMIVCGSIGHIHRVRGRRLPNGLGKYVGVPFSECPLDVLERFSRWLCDGPEGWCGHAFECG